MDGAIVVGAAEPPPPSNASRALLSLSYLGVYGVYYVVSDLTRGTGVCPLPSSLISE